MAPQSRQHMAMAAFLAWVGLGADGLSSANYGPEESFLALGGHAHLALYLALATALTVFVIALAYNQVIELFPSGGGGYKVATTLIGPRAGLISGSALIVDYVLTIAISIASGVDALFSLLPIGWQNWKLPAEALILVLLMILNMRGLKEPLKLLLPLFLCFLITHGGFIVGGILAHAHSLPALVPDTIADTRAFAGEIGWVAMLSLLLRAFALGGGTYTGIEAVSNNINNLKEPRVATGKMTMLYMASSLAFTAGGLIVLYLLWNPVPSEGMTLNASTFTTILAAAFGPDSWIGSAILLVTLTFAAGLLFVAANTGFLGGPAVLANMAADRWVPHQFSQLSNRLVTQNGLLLMGAAATGLLIITGGDVSVLVVLYSINVFLTFSLSLYGLSVYWWRNRRTAPRAYKRLALALLGFCVCAGILSTTIFEKFTHGAWLTVLITGVVIATGFAIRRHYRAVSGQLAKVDALFATAAPPIPPGAVQPLDPQAPTAVFLVGRSLGAGMHTLLSAQRLFPNQFKNFIFISIGEIDAESFHGEELLGNLREEVEDSLESYVNYCRRHGWASTSMHGFGTDVVERLLGLADMVVRQYPNSVFFAAQLIFAEDNSLTRLLHNQTAYAIQRDLHLRGVPMVILPMKL
ncbi:MAG TPA: APC family permease [Alphaproteobacteria bacterium]